MSRQAHEMGSIKRNGAVLFLLVAAVSGFGSIPSVPKSCIYPRYGMAHPTCVGLSGGCNLLSPVKLNAKPLGGGGGDGGGWGRWGGRGGDGGDGDDGANNPMGEDGGRY